MIKRIPEEHETLSSDISLDNIFMKIWTEPTKTLTYILKNYPEKYVTILLVLGGIVNSIDRASNKNMGDDMSTALVLLTAVIFGGLFGWISFYIYAWAMSVTGRWIDGKSEPSKFRTIIAWSLIPSICSLLLLIPELIIFGDDLFKSVPLQTTFFYEMSWLLFGLIELILGIWSLVILVKGVSLIQNFGTGKSILNIFLPALILIIPILAILMLVGILD